MKKRNKNEKVNSIFPNSIKDEDVYDLLLKIPIGKITTYGDIARALGNPSASRIVGQIVGKNPNPVKIPCHRVVKSDGKLGGYIYGMDKKRELLKKEGIPFEDDVTVADFQNQRFYP